MSHKDFEQFMRESHPEVWKAMLRKDAERLAGRKMCWKISELVGDKESRARSRKGIMG